MTTRCPVDGKDHTYVFIENVEMSPRSLTEPYAQLWQCTECGHQRLIPTEPEEEMEARHQAGDRWQVKSESGSAWHNIDLYIPKCSCKNWIFTINKMKSEGESDPHYECKHIKTALDAAHMVVFNGDARSDQEIHEAAEAIKARFRK